MEGGALSGGAKAVPDDAPIHWIGGGSAVNLSLKSAEAALTPPGISTLLGGGPAEAAEAMRQQFPRMAPRGSTVVGTTTVRQVRQAGFEVIMDATRRFPQHARLIHPAGAVGFSKENVERLARHFDNQSGL